MKSIFPIITLSVISLAITFSACNRKSSLTDSNTDRVVAKKDLRNRSEAPQIDKIEKTNESINPGDDIQTTPLRSPFQEEPDTVFLIRRTACYGSCPQYTALILSDGNVIYQGKRNVDKIGQYQSKISKRRVFELDGIIQKANFYAFEDEYPTSGEKIVDASNTIVFSEYQNKRKHILINHDAPEKLMDLINRMDEFFEELEWQSAEVLD